MDTETALVAEGSAFFAQPAINKPTTKARDKNFIIFIVKFV